MHALNVIQIDEMSVIIARKYGGFYTSLHFKGFRGAIFVAYQDFQLRNIRSLRTICFKGTTIKGH